MHSIHGKQREKITKLDLLAKLDVEFLRSYLEHHYRLNFWVPLPVPMPLCQTGEDIWQFGMATVPLQCYRGLYIVEFITIIKLNYDG